MPPRVLFTFGGRGGFTRHAAGPDISSKLSYAGLLLSINRSCLNTGRSLSRPTKLVARVPIVKQ